MKREKVKEESDRGVLENENDTLLWTVGVHN
jgi:hypothetical protein